MKRAKKKTVLTLQLDKTIFDGDRLFCFVGDKMISVKGTIPSYLLEIKLVDRKIENFHLQDVAEEQVEIIIEQLTEAVNEKHIERAGKMLFTNIAKRVHFKRLKAIIIYRNTIYQINCISIYTNEDGRNSIFFNVV